ncbi:putative C-type lectin domain family 20 member A isoform X1 [Clarias magur]|uniref:Putative C-type lectin domain family 20 member A isoform X1 n=1 Tax=Clarias magur TaxID=1594786 RepID=A0A8J4TWL0_CLAMG|nr:putative C-type lectin domain family 20 member A isoform X1 [Clarias magur]
MTWYEAQSYCRQHYTDLAIARNKTEMLIVQGLYSRWSTYTWIGLFRDYWKWIDQTNFSTITWMPGKPDNALGNEDCGSLTNIQADDDQCSSVKPFFCFSEVKQKQQVIRIKVESNQDVNELKAAIFGQIEQKLKDNGMTDEVTVEWRAQRDGMWGNNVHTHPLKRHADDWQGNQRRRNGLYQGCSLALWAALTEVANCSVE